MTKLGFSLQTSYALPIATVLPLLKQIGFDAVSPTWGAKAPLEDVVNTAAACGLILQSLHGIPRGLPAMWSKDDAVFRPVLQEFLNGVEDCRRFEIPMLVVHTWNGVDYTFPDEPLHFQNFDCLVEAAQRHNIQIAFENLEGPEYLCALMERYQNCACVGFCWDSGHELCYTPSFDFLRDYGDRLIMTHLNDNLGITDPNGCLCGLDDLHLLPGDGIIDWDRNLSRLQQAKRQEILNFELKIRPKGDRCRKDLYSTLPVEEYFAAAYHRARGIADRYDQETA